MSITKLHIFKPLTMATLSALVFCFYIPVAWGGWSSLTSGTTEDLRDVQFPTDANTGYVVGSTGTILKTTNGGTNWTPQTSGTTWNLTGLHFPIDATTGYVVAGGGTILKTTNGGSNWTSQTSGTTEGLLSVHFPVDTNTGYTSGANGVILKTTDGGTNWVAQTSGTAVWLYGVHFPSDATTGYIVGESGTILKTTNGGTNWTAQTSGVSTVLRDVFFLDATTGYAVGDSGTMLKTTDGGSNWNIQVSGTIKQLWSVQFPVDAVTGYVVANTEKTVRKSTDSGNSWAAQSSGVNEWLYGIHFPVDVNTGYVVGNGGTIIKTSDGGGSQSALHPTGDSSTSQFSPTGCASNWDCVNDQTGNAGTGSPEANNSADYLSGSSGQRVMFTLDSGTVPGGSTITAINIQAQVYRGNGSGANVSLSYQRMAGATTPDASPVDAAGIDLTTGCCTSTGNTWADLNWTTTDLDNLEIGLVHNSGGATSYITQLYVYVTYETGGPTYTISGKVFEDANFAGTAADYVDETTDKALVNVDVELYDNSDVYQESTTTDANGDFSFTGLANATYKVRVRSVTLADVDTTPKGTFNACVPATCSYPIPGMTWGNGSAMYGGQSATTDDTATGDNAGIGDTYVSVTVSGSDVTAVNFGFAHNLIVNVEDSGQGSLRQFILNANAIGTTGSTTANSSQFNMQVAMNQASWWRISPTTVLDTLTDDGTTIDAYTQPGAAVNTAAFPAALNGTLAIELDGSGAGVSNGLTINSADNTVKGLIINGFSPGVAGIDINGASATGNKVEGNYIGTNFDGTSPVPNARGVTLQNSAQNNTIGGTTPDKRNIISGNSSYGLYLFFTANDNTIQGNYIGSAADGTTTMGNDEGIIVLDATGTIIGGTAAGAGNLISGNDEYGVWFTDAGAIGGTVQGNYIGVAADGATALPNVVDGIRIDWEANGNTIGGNSAAARNIISGNTANGITIDKANSDNNTIQGNYIGVQTDGVTARPNGGHGIEIKGSAKSNTIGGTGADEGNIISGNGANGIYISGTGTDNNMIYGNYIGTSADGTADVGNTADGIAIDADASNNKIGDTLANSGNVISGNDSDGISIDGASTSGNTMLKNYIGTNAAGDADLGNTTRGIYLNNVGTNNIGDAAGNGNLISGNNNSGIYITGTTSNITIQGNSIGTNLARSAVIKNNSYGINIDAGSNFTIGGTAAGAENTVAIDLSSAAISISGSTSDVTVHGNYIGTDSTETFNLGGFGVGVLIMSNAAPSNIDIGGVNTGEGNVIANSTSEGVLMMNPATFVDVIGNTIYNNSEYGIGIYDMDSTTIAMNLIRDNGVGGSTKTGISLLSGSSNTRIYNNTIHGNVDNGIEIDDAGITGTIIKNNIITANGGWGIDNSIGATITNDYNNVPASPTTQGNTSGSCTGCSLGANSLSNDPLYTNEPADLYTLQASSTAINRGCNLGAAGDDTGCDSASDGAQVDLTAGANPNFYGFGPDLGAYENNSVTNTCIVSSTADSGYATLRECITWANGNAGQDTITFDAGMFNPGTITVSSVLPNLSDASGTIIDATGVTVTLDGGSVDIHGFVINSSSNEIYNLTIQNFGKFGLWFISGSHSNIIDGNTIHDNSQVDTNAGAIFLVDCDNNQFLNNEIYNHGGFVQVFTGSSGNLFQGNTFYNNGNSASAQGALYLGSDSSVTDTVIQGNLFRDQMYNGVFVDQANNTKIYHNTFHNNGVGTSSSGVYIQLNTTGATIIKNNIFTNNGRNGIRDRDNGAYATIDYNDFFGNVLAPCSYDCLTATNNLSVDPLYTNPGGNIFTLQNSSPAINRGCDLGAAGDDTGCDDANDEAQPDLTAGANPNFYGFGPDLGAYENTLATTCPVSTAADASPTAPYGSLRDCINYANANAGTTVQFSIGGTPNQSDTGDTWWRITAAAAMPDITAANTTIDGSTQASIISNSNTRGPEIEINGASAGAGVDGLMINNVGSVTIKELVINGFTQDGIEINGASATSSVIHSNYIGTDAVGEAASANTTHGIYVTGGSGTNIGGANVGEGNLISGNGSFGIYLNNSNSNSVRGNTIGLDRLETSVIANSSTGINIDGTSDSNQVGGSGANEGNTIGGNGNIGLTIDSVTNVDVWGNTFGGGAGLGNTNAGIGVSGNDAAANINIGGLNAGEGNEISYSTAEGIITLGLDLDVDVIGNTIYSNATNGVTVLSSSNLLAVNEIYDNGTTTSHHGVQVASGITSGEIYHNTIHNNAGDGIFVEGTATAIRNNIITGSGAYGLNVTGSVTTESNNLITDAVTSPANTSGDSNIALDASDVNSDPLYNNEPAYDYTLSECTSPAIETGVDLGGGQPDMNGAGAGNYNGFQPDMGANESSCVSDTTIGDGTAPSNKTTPINSTNNAVSTFTLVAGAGTDTLTALTVTLSGTGVDADVATNGVKLWRDDGSTANEWDSTDTQIGSGVSFSSGDAAFSGLSEGINTTATQYLITYDIGGATAGNTLLGAVTAATVTNSLTNNDNTDATLTVGNCEVVNTNDGGTGSLRICIAFANTNPGSTISFNIPSSDGGYQTAGADNWWRITLTSVVLPTINANGTIIDGSTQTTNQGDTNSLGPEIEIYGGSLGAVDGLSMSSANNTINDLIVNSFGGGGKAGILLTGASATNNTISDNYIGTDYTGASPLANYYGVYINNSDGNTLSANTIDHNSAHGVNIAGTTNGSSGNLITGNSISNSAWNGLKLGDTSSTSNRIEVNIFDSNGQRGIQITSGGNDTLIYNNTVHNSSAGDGIQIASGVTGTIIRNNIITNSSGGDGIEDGDLGASTIIDYNDFNGNSNGPCNYDCTTATNNITGDPLYVNAAGGNFALTEPTSPAINAGCDLGAAGDDTACDNASDGAQPDLNGGTAGNFNGSAPDMGAVESSIAGATTTIGDGTEPSSQTVSVNSTNKAVSAFTLSTDSGTDTLTALTVTRSGTSSDSDVATNGVKLWRDDGSTANEWDSGDIQIGSGVSLSSGTASFSSLSESINTTPTQYIVTYDIASNATGGNTLLGVVTAATVTNSLVNNDTTDATLTVAGLTCDVDPSGTYIEAEALSETFAGDGTYTFAGILNAQSGYLGSGYLETDNKVNMEDFSHVNANLGLYERYDYRVNFPTTGTYNVWIRAYETGSDADDSIFIGLDGTATGAIKEVVQGGWEWTNTVQNGATTITIGSAGTHTINVWPREQTHKLDGIYITTGATTPTDGIHGIDLNPTNCATTTIADGATPSSKTTPINSTNNAVSAFTLATDFGVDNLTALTVTLSGTGADADVATNGVKLWRDDGATANEWDSTDTQIGSGVSFSSGTASIGGLFEGINTSATQYLITYDIANGATAGNTLLGVVTAATVWNSLANNDNSDATLTVGGCLVINTGNSGAGSLSDCIDFANLNTGTTISFDIPSSDGGYQTAGADNWWRISPVATLPTITANSTIIDGTTQTTNQGDANSLGPEIEIYGAGAGVVDGLTITSGSNTIKDLIVNSYGSANRIGIKITGASATSNTISGSYIGTNYAASSALANYYGIVIRGAASSNTVGGTTAAERNIISGNSFDAIGFADASTTNNVVTGNYIGTNRTGTSILANSYGVTFSTGPTSNTVGGTTAAERNIISGSSIEGVRFWGVSGNTISGNYIGTDVNGTAAIANAVGIGIWNSATVNTIGSTISGGENIIAYSSGDGIYFNATANNSNVIQLNEIRDNQQHGINITGGNSAKIYHNTIYNNGLAVGYDGISIATGITGTLIKNNILSSNNAYGVDDADSGASTVVDYDDLFSNGTAACNYDCTTATNNITDDPQYNNAGADDYTLTECASMAINKGVDLAGDQPDMNGGTAGNFNSTAPDMGAYETSCVGSGSDLVIDDDFSDWCDGEGVEMCIDDEGGNDDYTTPERLDITRLGVASNRYDTFYLMLGYDDTDLGQQSTACILMDSTQPSNDTIDLALCAVIDGTPATSVSSVELYNCDDSIAGGCGDATLNKTYGASDFGFDRTSSGPWNIDSLLEIKLPYADLGIAGGDVIMTSLISYPGTGFLKSPKDSIFDTGGEQDYEKRIQFDTDSGTGVIIAGPGNQSVSGIVYTDEGTTTMAAGKTVRLIVDGADKGTDTTDANGGYFISANINDSDPMLVYIDGDATYDATTATVFNAPNLTAFDIYADHVITRHDNAGSLTFNNMSTAKGVFSDTEILYSPAGGNLTVNGANTELYVPATHTFIPGADVDTVSLEIVGTLTAGSNTYNVSGNWTNNGTFTAGTSTVVLDGGDQGISGSTTFNNLSKTESTNDATDLTLTFDNTATQTINGILTLDGLDDDDRINLVSDSPATQWSINLAATATKVIDYIEVTDSDASGSDASKKPVNPTNSLNGGNTIDWFSLPLVKAVFKGDTCVASSDGDAACNGGVTSTSVLTGEEITFVIYVTNSNGSAATDVRFQDDIDDVGPDYFEFQGDTYAVGQGIKWATTGSASSTKVAIKTALNGGTALTNAFDGSTGGNEYCGIDTAASPDVLICGGDASSPDNDQVDVANDDIFAVMFNAVKRD